MFGMETNRKSLYVTIRIMRTRFERSFPMTATRNALRGLALLGFLTTGSMLANTQFTARRMTRNDVPLSKGQCDIRLQIDGEAEVSVEGDRVFIRTISGRDGRDDGSECNEPLPRGDVREFNFEVRDSRGEIVL